MGEPPLLLAKHLLENNLAADQFEAGRVGQQWSVC